MGAASEGDDLIDVVVRLRDGRIVSDHPTDQDPIHQDFLRRAAAQAVGAAAAAPPASVAVSFAVNVPTAV